MFKTSKRELIVVISLFIIFLITLISTLFILLKFNILNKQNNSNFILKNINLNPAVEIKINKAPNIFENKYQNYSWRISIPKINLDAPIIEGTSKDILRKGVGHFINTGYTNRKYLSCCT